MDMTLYIERIEKYEAGTMDAAERDAFETELASNAELRQARAIFLQTGDVLEQAIENTLRSQLQDWAKEEAKPAGGKVVSMSATWVRLAAAASVALLLGWFGWQWAGTQYSDQALFASHYEKPVDQAFRAGNTQHPFQSGFEALQTGNLNAAVAFFNNIASNDDRYDEAQYYLGHSYLQLKSYADAIKAFTRAADGQDARFKEKAEWNLVLTYLEAGMVNEPAFTTLIKEMVDNTGHSYHTQAVQLQQELGSFWRR